MAGSFIEDLFDNKSPEEQRNWLRRATNLADKTIRRMDLQCEGSDIINIVLEIIMTNQACGDYARLENECSDDYFYRCMGIWIKREKWRVDAERRRRKAVSHHDVMDLIHRDIDKSPEQNIIDNENIVTLKREITAATTRSGSLRKFVEFLYEDPESGNEEIAKELDTSPENVRQQRSRLRRILKARFIIGLLLCLALTTAKNTFGVMIYAHC